jgi:hypothetical protein
MRVRLAHDPGRTGASPARSWLASPARTEVTRVPGLRPGLPRRLTIVGGSLTPWAAGGETARLAEVRRRWLEAALEASRLPRQAHPAGPIGPTVAPGAPRRLAIERRSRRLFVIAGTRRRSGPRGGAIAWFGEAAR